MVFKKLLLCCVSGAILISTTVFAKTDKFYKPYDTVGDVEHIQPKLYVVHNVNVSLSSKINAPDFLNQEQVKERYIQKLNDALGAQNMLANEHTEKPILVDFDIKQKRVFAGEDLSFISSKVIGKYAHTEFQYTSTLSYNNAEIAKLSVDKMIGIGKNGSFGKIYRDLSGSGKAENELEDIDAFTMLMIENLPK
ncbi:hypothetical protein [Acinetobacter boissieri]|uniref:DUF4410 domain-containing protein n=1 Tax=Acinetobacter boissieri TaxID=1219383 RepID=A0A1G6H5Z0_9GAMM|nr:hypothetical protein [Acinetobacter boissieri]SDB88856.1 hypothetical protein SAMN05421733_103257 [Acinetobacter boissieri]